MGIKDTFSKLKQTIVGVSSADIDSKLDAAVKDITSYKSNSGTNGYIDLVRSVISKTGEFQLNVGQGGIFAQGSSPATLGQGTRLARYKTYEAIVYNINYCFRALAVLTDNIMAPDDINKTSLEIIPQSYLEDAVPTESKTKYVEEVLKNLKLEKHINIIVKNTLMLGDFFVEIADAKTALTSQSILSEGVISGNVNDDYKDVIAKNIGENNLKFELDYTSYFDEQKQKNKDDNDITNVHLLFHDPHRVVKLQSDMFPLCFGYLIFPKNSYAPHLAVGDETVNNVCKQLLTSLAKKIPQTKELRNDKDLKDIIASMVKGSDPTNQLIDIRYVPPSKVEHFYIPSTKYYPYGESIFDSCSYSGKVLIAMETALAISRLSRSTEKRKIQIEIGLPRDAAKAIEGMKEEFRKRKISLDSFGSVDTIPSMITTFEDIYIPAKDGKPFVDVNTFTEGNIDVRSKVDELKFVRDQLIASLGVPSSFINIEENLSNKSALSEENILFARTIVNHQKYLSEQITELTEKILQIVNPEKALDLLDNVIVAFPPPKSLQFERESKYMNDVATLIETLERIGIPKEYSKKKYLTQIDWDDVKKYEIEANLDKDLGTEKEEEPGMGGMGGVSGMM